MINVTVAGRLGKDAEIREAGNSTVCSFSVAGNTGFGDRKQTHWFECSLWGNQGLALAQYLKKGQQVTVIGEFSEREYQGKQYKEIRVHSVELQSAGDIQSYQQPQNNQPSSNPYVQDMANKAASQPKPFGQPSTQPPMDAPDDSEDIPF